MHSITAWMQPASWKKQGITKVMDNWIFNIILWKLGQTLSYLSIYLHFMFSSHFLKNFCNARSIVFYPPVLNWGMLITRSYIAVQLYQPRYIFVYFWLWLMRHAAAWVGRHLVTKNDIRVPGSRHLRVVLVYTSLYHAHLWSKPA